MTDWITHEGSKPPLLAPAALVRALVYTLDRSAFSSQRRTVASVPWKRCDQYHPLTDDEGHKLISAEGLEEWAEWVAIDIYGSALQFPESLNIVDATSAPKTHSHPGNPRDSLYRVEGR